MIREFEFPVRLLLFTCIWYIRMSCRKDYAVLDSIFFSFRYVFRISLSKRIALNLHYIDLNWWTIGSESLQGVLFSHDSCRIQWSCYLLCIDGLVFLVAHSLFDFIVLMFMCCLIVYLLHIICKKEDIAQQHQFILHAALDVVQDVAWTTSSMWDSNYLSFSICIRTSQLRLQ